MEKQKRWQFFVILAVIVLTLYNILPTIIFYSKPLSSPVDKAVAMQTAKASVARIDGLQEESIQWLESFCKLLHVNPTSIKPDKDDPGEIQLEFSNENDAQIFAKLLPRAGSLISFVPAQLSLGVETSTEKKVVVLRQLPILLGSDDTEKLFQFATKENSNGTVTDAYFTLVGDRFTQVALALAGHSPQAMEVAYCLAEGEKSRAESFVGLAQNILRVTESFGEDAPITNRYFAGFTRGTSSAVSSMQLLVTKMQEEVKALDRKRQGIIEEKKIKEEQNQLIDSEKLEQLKNLQRQIATLESCIKVLEAKAPLLQTQNPSETKTSLASWLLLQKTKIGTKGTTFLLDIGEKNPYFSTLGLDWGNDSLVLQLHPDVLEILTKTQGSENIKLQQDELSRLIINEVARVTQTTDEKIVQGSNSYKIPLYRLQNSKSFLTLNLKEIADKTAQGTADLIARDWNPSHADLAKDKLPFFDVTAYQAAPGDQKRLCMLLVSPTSTENLTAEFASQLRPSSIYVILRGIQSIIDQYHRFPESKEAKLFGDEVSQLAKLLHKRGFISYSGTTFGETSPLAKDLIFELDDYYSMLLLATREDFYVLGSKKFAQLEFSDLEQRILTENRIADTIQEDLLKWKENYQAAQVDLDPTSRLTVPKPTENAYVANFKRACRAYFRGDDSKIIRWGLDLSGGKSVRVALYDQSHRPVTNPEDLRQAVNELYTRINKMGVSERTIRIENSTILIDFPGAQGVSATELVKASAMYFHIANEQFGLFNQALARDTNSFLQDVWNEAVVTNKKEVQDINEIAWNKLQSAAKKAESNLPGVKDSAQVLYEAGLRLANPREYEPSVAFDDTISKMAKYRDEDTALWAGQGHPLLVVFANFALEGSSLENVMTSYDASKGNILTFGVKSSYSTSKWVSGTNPRDDFYNWTSQFSEEKIAGTSKETLSGGRGWRMAVILNGQVISAPTLHAALRDQAMISGNFSQREVSKLATDLRAGSLSFTPKILSEQNVSPELGKQERSSGIIAATCAIVLVVVMMVSYYHFAGIVASIAVLFNMLITWAVMQNIEFVLTLPGIAGVVLAVAMAVDANVLVFERIREEFQLSGRIASAIQLGYKKAFSAIIDSNITTILAALILLQFDCGPIRGFAITLVIGIVSSMFTALFMTRYFFAGWVQNPKHTELKMSKWITAPSFDFLKWTKPALGISIALFAFGAMVTIQDWKSLFGMDFTGGYSLIVDLQETNSIPDPRSALSKTLVDNGLSSKEFQIRELGRPNLLRIQLGVSLELPGEVFHGMPLELPGTSGFVFEKNPRILWVAQMIKKSGLEIKESELPLLANNWTAMSGQFSEAMRNNAVIALSLSLLAVLFYIAFRFEWKFAISAILALIHDVVLTVCVAAIAHRFGAPVQIDLEVIGAIMTIIGYSLNDTIIVFDRVREDMRLMRKKTLREIINHALNITLSRTLMTSGTTLVALCSLVFFGGKALFGFSFVMTVGVFLGTLSSLFIASSLLLYLEEKSARSQKLISQS